MNNEIFAYVRVSSISQNLDRQLDNMKKLGIREENIFVDKMSGKNLDRPNYQLLKVKVRRGDVVVFDSITRMSRNMEDIKAEYKFFADKGAFLKFIKEPMLDTSDKTDDVMRQAINDIILTILGAFAQKEREEIKERQREGIEAAKRRGKHLGRPKVKLTDNQLVMFEAYYSKWKNGEMTAVELRNRMGLAHNTFYNKVKLYEEQLQII